MTNKINDFEKSLEEKQAECDEVTQIYDELQSECDKISEELASIDVDLDDETIKAQIEYYNQQLNELIRLKEEYEASNQKFDDVYYARAGYEEQVKNSEIEKNEAMAKVKEAVTENADDETLSSQITNCAKLIEEYNKAVEQLEKWYDELDSVLFDRNEKNTAYNAQKKLVEEQAKVVEKANYCAGLLEKLAALQEKKSLVAAELSEYVNIMIELQYSLDDLYGSKESADALIAQKNESYNAFIGAADVYRNAISTLIIADDLVKRAEEGYQQTVSSFDDMKDKIESYMTEEVSNPYQEKLDIVDAVYNEMDRKYAEGKGYYQEIADRIENDTLESDRAQYLIEKANDIINELDNLDNSIQSLCDKYEEEIKGVIDYWENGAAGIAYMYAIQALDPLSNSIADAEREYEYCLRKYEEAYKNHKEATDYYKTVQNEVAPIKDKIEELEKEKTECEKEYNGEAGSKYAKAIEEAQAAQSDLNTSIENTKVRIQALQSLIGQWWGSLVVRLLNEENARLIELYAKQKDVDQMFADAEQIRTDAYNRIEEINPELEALNDQIRNNYNESFINEYYQYVKALDEKTSKLAATIAEGKPILEALYKEAEDNLKGAETAYNQAKDFETALEQYRMSSSGTAGSYRGSYDYYEALMKDYFRGDLAI